MKIAINLLPYTSYQGIETYTCNLIKALAATFPEVEFVLIKHSLSPKFLDFRGDNIKEIVLPLKKRSRGILAIIQQTKLYFVLHKMKPDFLFSTSPSAPFFYPRNVIVIHDCAYDRFSEFSNVLSKIYFKWMYYFAKHFAVKIITDSEFSKNELWKLYNLQAQRVEVVYLGQPTLPVVAKALTHEIKEKFELNLPYFIYVGNTRPRKNIPGLLRAFKLFREKYPEYKLVLAGKIDLRFLNVTKKINELGLGDSVVQTGFISDEEKVALYRGAVALVFPSYYEGFGLPVLEAQSLDVPVLTSNISSLPEVGANSVLYVDPYSVNSIAAGLEKLAMDKALLEDLIRRGRENIKRFSWEKAARKLMEILKNNETLAG